MVAVFSSTFTHLSQLTSKVLTAYTTWKIHPTREEARSYNTTKKILLTFDDFADKATVDRILAILKEENVKAAFFLVGDWTESNTSLVAKIQEQGHWVGNHTKTHANLLALSDQQIIEEIQGGPKSSLLRPPYGKYNQNVRDITQKLGYKICYWTIDTDDWKGVDSQTIESRVYSALHAGACILMHLHAKHTVEVLPNLINGIRSRGFELCSSGKEIAI